MKRINSITSRIGCSTLTHPTSPVEVPRQSRFGTECLAVGSRDFDTGTRLTMAGYPSTISFRSSLVLSYLKEIELVESEIGWFLYYLTLDNDAKIIFDPSILMRYRIRSEHYSTSRDLTRYIGARKIHVTGSAFTCEVLLDLVPCQMARSELRREFYHCRSRAF